MTSLSHLYARQLTIHEVRVIHGAAHGLTNAEIGRAGYIGVSTVRTHMRRAMRKLGAHNRAHAVALTLRLGVLAIEDGRVVIPGQHLPQPEAARARRALADEREVLAVLDAANRADVQAQRRRCLPTTWDGHEIPELREAAQKRAQEKRYGQ